MRRKLILFAVMSWLVQAGEAASELRVGQAGHAFDHLGEWGEQAEAAAASGANIIYATGLGELGYNGLPPETELAEKRRAVLDYNQRAKAKGIRRSMGYVCATSLVKLDSFDKNWSKKFRAQFQTAPADWRQVGRDGQPLPSWYGGDYHPACLNNPDWRNYEKFMVQQQLESGHDGIFFDNPTVHPQGCYCRHCLGKFVGFLHDLGWQQTDFSVAKLRELPEKHPGEFLRFRSTIARDFLAEMKAHARRINRTAVVTCNHSLNAPDALFSQSRVWGYNIDELSKVTDWVVVEDMVSQPRRLPDGRVFEYGATYDQLTAISHGKPVVAVTLADGNYRTPPNQVRLALAEAAAHGASYLWWPTWPEKIRGAMSTSIHLQADFLRKNSHLLNDTERRRDVVLFLPFRRWLETNRCTVSDLAAALTRSNVQYQVISEDDFALVLDHEIARGQMLRKRKAIQAKTSQDSLPVFLTESLAVLTASERSVLQKFEAAGGRVVAADQAEWWSEISPQQTASVRMVAPSSVRVVLHDQPNHIIAHVYNLAVERVSDVEDRVHSVSNLKIKIRLFTGRVKSVKAWSANVRRSSDHLPFSVQMEDGEAWMETTLPKLDVATLVVVEF